MTDEKRISLSDLEKLDRLVSTLDGDKQQAFNKILHNLSSPIVIMTPDINCPPEKIMVDRREWEAVLQELNKQHFEE